MKRFVSLLFLLHVVLLVQACSEAINSHDDSPEYTAVLSRLNALEAEAEIRLKLQTYMAALNASDWDTHVTYFTHDATLVMGEGNRHGRADIKERMSAASTRMANAAQGQPLRKRADLLSNIEIEVIGNTARVQSRFTFIAENDQGGFDVAGSGLYLDEWAKEEGEWRIALREVDYDMLRISSSQ